MVSQTITGSKTIAALIRQPSFQGLAVACSLM